MDLLADKLLFEALKYSVSVCLSHSFLSMKSQINLPVMSAFTRIAHLRSSIDAACDGGLKRGNERTGCKIVFCSPIEIGRVQVWTGCTW